MSPASNSSICTNPGGEVTNSKSSDKKNYIEHEVSKFDTLAGIAIKYGVEVVDIKRLNGLVTDLQMFALKTLLIPLPGRHPPSPALPPSSASPSRGNGIKKTGTRPPQLNLLESFESSRLKTPEKKVSSAMNTLQKFYGLRPSNDNNASEGTEMSVYRSGSLDELSERLLAKASPISVSSYWIPKTRSLMNGSSNENGVEADYIPLPEAEDGEDGKLSEKSVRRRQKAEGDARASTPEKLLREGNSAGSWGFSPVPGKGLAMRPKSASRTALASELDQGWINPRPVGLGDSLIADEQSVVRKSTSTPILQDQDNSSSSSIWPTSKWNLKPDLQALSTAAINMPIFDGLPKPIAGRRSKAALD